MKRVLKITNAAQSYNKSPPTSFTLTRSPRSFRFTHEVFVKSTPTSTAQRRINNVFSELIMLFSAKPPEIRTREMEMRAALLGDELVQCANDRDKVFGLLDEKGNRLFRVFRDKSFFLLLMKCLRSWPHLALQIFYWRRKHAWADMPMTSEEYAKAISIAGRTKNIDLAIELFTEASSKRLKTTSTYNGLMFAFVYNGLTDKCQGLFRALKREATCSPTIVTYNILISLYGRLMLVDQMEKTFQEIYNSNLSPNLGTYNNLIAGYITAWMWDSMENTFQSLNAGPNKPDTHTYALMIRGYAHAGNLEKMEKMYELVKDYVNNNEVQLIRTMIIAYCRSSSPDRVKKVEELTKLIPANEYKSWLNVVLIKFYAREDMLEAMEKSIDEALQRKTVVINQRTMKAISATYYRCNAVDKFANFVKQAEYAGWRICRSLYHCKMIMYMSENRWKEIEDVLSEMDNYNICRTKKTYVILYWAYSMYGPRYKVDQVLGLMFKNGFELPLGVFPS